MNIIVGLGDQTKSLKESRNRKKGAAKSVNKGDGVTNQSLSCLSANETSQSEQVRDPGAQEHLPSASLCVSSRLLLSVVLIHSTVH